MVRPQALLRDYRLIHCGPCLLNNAYILITVNILPIMLMMVLRLRLSVLVMLILPLLLVVVWQLPLFLLPLLQMPFSSLFFVNTFSPAPDKLSGATKLPSAPTPEKLSGIFATFALASFCFNSMHT